MVIRSPRLALVGDPADGALSGLVTALVSALRAWQIPVALFSNEPPRGDGAPWRAVHQESLAVLGRLAEGSLRPEPNRWAIANGGDMTLLECPAEVASNDVSAETDALLRTAALTRTPLVLAVSAAAPPLGVAAFVRTASARHSDVSIGGFVTIGSPQGSPDSGPWRELGVPSLGWAPALPPLDREAPAPPDPIRELADHAAAPPAEAGFDLDLLALMRLGNTAPALVDGHADGAPAAGRRRRRSGRRDGRGRALMIQGTHSSAGKTFIATALARHFSNRGLSVAPFKGQNMSNNSRVARGGEIGVAQYMQALAARTEPDVRMNPVLLKPHDTGSHVILMGRPQPELTALPWRLRKPPMWPTVRAALHELLDEHDLVLIEGAGSPAEPYMYHNDIVNMRVAREVNAAAILVSDAGQGGAIAQSYGTWRMIPEGDRELVRGFVFNKFYAPGYVDLFLPGCAQLERLTGVPSLGVLPMLDVDLPDEDLHSLSAHRHRAARRIAILAYPRISNFDEFTPLQHVEGVGIVWARSADELAGADLVILPGSKNVPSDIDWLRDRGIEAALREHISAGKPLLGICGGLQMLGERIEDPAGVEGSAVGLGVLPLVTVHDARKVQVRTKATFESLEDHWRGLNGLTVDTYQIRHGRTSATGPVTEVLPEGMGFARGNVAAISLHGIFENSRVVAALFGETVDPQAMLESSFEAASAALEEHLDMAGIERLAYG
jgi:adenosylcobyric acid synthase